jgi:hypothetical protein
LQPDRQLDRNYSEEVALMKKLNREDAFAVLSAVIVMVGVLFAAEDALAGSDVREPEAQIRLPARVACRDAAARQAEMAERAADSIIDAARLELDIRLGNHTSSVRVRK